MQINVTLKKGIRQVRMRIQVMSADAKSLKMSYLH